MRGWGRGAVVLIWATTAFAQDLGDGHLGDLTVDTPLTVLNRDDLALSRDVKAGDTELPVGSTLAYYPSTLLLMIRIRGGSADGTESAQAGAAGDYFFTRISHINLAGFEISPALDRDWPASDTEIISVPEYRNLTITSTGSVYAPNWNGAVGGVVAILVTDELKVDGTLNADGIGFRGGVAGSAGIANGMGCMSPNEPAPNGAQKGEGLLSSASWANTLTGFGRNANGAGGGVCQSSGGGGGGNFGKGGSGGASTDGLRPVGGEGGAAVLTNGFKPLFGGGGGAGTRDSSGDGTSGGAGGGIVIVRAGHISGSGIISARGADALSGPPESPVNQGSPGGGGAGGSIDIVSARSPTCHVSVKGGNGGLPAGGGGGGGRVRFSAPNSDGCTAELFAGQGASSGDKQAQPQSPQAQGYMGTLVVETISTNMMNVPGRYEFRTFGCSSAGGGLGWLALVLLMKRRSARL
ncbi:MAG: hypothetical protein QM723_24450 [Myxococcaceae bacterium]